MRHKGTLWNTKGHYGIQGDIMGHKATLWNSNDNIGNHGSVRNFMGQYGDYWTLRDT